MCTMSENGENDCLFVPLYWQEDPVLAQITHSLIKCRIHFEESISDQHVLKISPGHQF